MGCFSDYLFDIFIEEIEQSQEWDEFLRSVKQHLPKITRIFVNCYRDGTAVTEMVIHYNTEEILLLTILSDDLNFPPVSDEDMRVNYKIPPGFLLSWIPCFGYPFCFEASEQAFHRRVVPTMTFTAETLGHTIAPEWLPERQARVMATLS